MGRPKKPTEISMLDGNPGKRPLNDEAPRFEKGIPACPELLTDEAREEWDYISKILDGAGLLTMADKTALESYCQAYKTWVTAVREMSKPGGMVITCESGYAQVSPWVSIASGAQKEIKNYLSSFGLTPSARVSLKVPQDTPETEYGKLRKDRQSIKDEINAAMKDGKLKKFEP